MPVQNNQRNIQELSTCQHVNTDEWTFSEGGLLSAECGRWSNQREARWRREPDGMKAFYKNQNYCIVKISTKFRKSCLCTPPWFNIWGAICWPGKEVYKFDYYFLCSLSCPWFTNVHTCSFINEIVYHCLLGRRGDNQRLFYLLQWCLQWQ